MKASFDNYAAVVVLPPVSGGRLQDASLRAWLSRSNFRLEPMRRELLARIAGVMGVPYPKEGLAALRMWGQTGDRPSTWLAGADPVYLEPRLDHLCLHALGDTDVQPPELRALFDHLQSTLARDRQTGFVQLGTCGYLHADEAVATAAVPPCVVDQQLPGEYLPEGRSAASHRNLLSEIEMSLHDHAVNRRRDAIGNRPINSLWLWGGGFAPERDSRVLPPLFTDEPLLLGYWDCANAVANRWPGSIATCIETAGAAFVAATPESGNGPGFLRDCLQALQSAVRSRQIRRLTILFRDGRRADIRRSHELRFWRRESRLLE